MRMNPPHAPPSRYPPPLMDRPCPHRSSGTPHTRREPLLCTCFVIHSILTQKCHTILASTSVYFCALPVYIMYHHCVPIFVPCCTTNYYDTPVDITILFFTCCVWSGLVRRTAFAFTLGRWELNVPGSQGRGAAVNVHPII